MEGAEPLVADGDAGAGAAALVLADGDGAGAAEPLVADGDAGAAAEPAPQQFSGVQPRGDVFEAIARIAGRRVFLGVFGSERDAARAADKALLLSGAAPLNFAAADYAAEENLAPLAGLEADALVKEIKARVAAAPHRTRLSRFRGVTVTKERRWRPEIKVAGVLVSLGVYEDEVEAARVYDKACIMLRGSPAHFPAEEYEDDAVEAIAEGADAAEALRAAFNPRPQSSAFTGTSLRKEKAGDKGKPQRWEAYIKVAGKKLNLGLHNSEEGAARAYDRAHLQLRGTAVNYPVAEYDLTVLPRLTLGPNALSGDALRAALKPRHLYAPSAAAGVGAGADEAAAEEVQGAPSKRPRLAEDAVPASSKFFGVSLRKGYSKGDGSPRWEAFVKLGGRKVALGMHASEAVAARAHDAALLISGLEPRNFPASVYAADVASGRLAARPGVLVEELRGLAVPKPDAHPTLLGVTRGRHSTAAPTDTRWRAALAVDGATMHWGTGGDASAAALAYDVARVCLKGAPANAAANDPRLVAVRRAPETLRGDALRTFVADAVLDAFEAMGLGNAIIEAPAPAAPAPVAALAVNPGNDGGGMDKDEEELLLESPEDGFD